MSESPALFLSAACQVGAEAALKEEVARTHANWNPAYSRRGFVTFKVPDGEFPADAPLPNWVFARRASRSLGNVEGAEGRELAAAIWKLVGEEQFDHLHIWERDSAVVGDRNFEPGHTELAESVGKFLVEASSVEALPINQQARPGQRVLDCVVVEPNNWWIGWHKVVHQHDRWPGGVPEIVRPPEVISRAYLKMTESIMWSQMPLRQNDVITEIGAAPGGSCQALLDRGLYVIGIDPAEIDSLIIRHPRFRHIRRRGREVRKMEFNEVNWLAADSNVSATHTLDTVEAIVTHPSVKIKGLLLTLKLLEWSQASSVPDWLNRVRQWGFGMVQGRQLAFGRQEICVAAQRSRAMRKRAKRVLKKSHSKRA